MGAVRRYMFCNMNTRDSCAILLWLVIGCTAVAHIGASCSTSTCTSPSASGGNDCWAGSKKEPCTCSSGEAATTGAKTTYDGQEYVGYKCCDSEASATANNLTWVGEKCGAYSAAASIQVVSFSALGLVALGSLMLSAVYV